MGFGTALMHRLGERGGRIALGSDIESGMAGDMFSVARFALQAARHDVTLKSRAETGAPPATMPISLREALAWATIDGARVLELAGRIGSLTSGKQADIILIGARGIYMRPVRDPVASALFHAGPRDVDTVMAAGRVTKRSGRLVADGLDRLMDAVCASGDRIMAAFHAGISGDR